MLLQAQIASYPLASFATVVGLVICVGWFALIIRGRLPPGSTANANEVRASLFSDKLRYSSTGPVAEFVVLLATLAFVVAAFWFLLTGGV